MNEYLPPPNEKLTISLAAADLALVGKIMKLTGAYTKSEVVRDALRLRYAALTDNEKKGGFSP